MGQASERVNNRHSNKQYSTSRSRPQSIATKSPARTPGRGDPPMSPIMTQLSKKLSSVRVQIDDAQEQIVQALSTLDESSLNLVTDLNAKVETLVKIERQLAIAIEHRNDVQAPIDSLRSPSQHVVSPAKHHVSPPVHMPAPPARSVPRAQPQRRASEPRDGSHRDLPPVDASQSNRSGRNTNRSARSAHSVRSALQTGLRERLMGFYSAHNP